jgi:hypothetical protein
LRTISKIVLQIAQQYRTSVTSPAMSFAPILLGLARFIARSRIDFADPDKRKEAHERSREPSKWRKCHAET